MITVIIPSHRPQNYIYKCIDSIADQSIDSDKYEVIIILNGEMEPFFSSLNNYIKSLANFKCVYNSTKGVSSARNLGLEMAVNADYVVFLDDDDYVTHNYLEKLYNTITYQKVELAQSNLKSDIGGTISNDYISEAFNALQNKPFKLFTFRNFFSSVCAKMYDRNIIGNIKFREDIKIAEDAIFLFTLSKNIKNISLTASDCIYYRNVREGSTIRSHRSINTIVKNYFRKGWIFSSIFFSDPFKYSPVFYLTRLMAITKVLFIELKTNVLKSTL